MIDESTNRILYVADNLRVMRGIESESIDLIATDPPFNSKRSFNAPLGSRAAKQKFDDRWRWDEVTDEWHDVIAADHPAIKELVEAAVVIEGGTVDPKTGTVDTGRVTNSIAAFIAWMAPRVVEMHRILKPTGSLYLHCDPAANAYLRLLLDAVFGRANFRNEIVWQRTNRRSDARRFGRIHDTLLYYARGGSATWNAPYLPHDPAYVQRTYRNSDELGRWRAADLMASGTRNGESGEPWRGIDPNQRGNHWRTPSQGGMRDFIVERGLIPGWPDQFPGVHQRLDALDAAGLIYWPSKKSGVPCLKRYLLSTKGNAVCDIFTDIGKIEAQAKENTKWATQKPLALYSRIIEASSNQGELVLDPFCGCATTCVAAELLQRCWIGIDIDPMAESVTKDRLREEARIFELDGNPVTVRKTPSRRADIPQMSDAKLRVTLWNNQGRRCANPYCDSSNLRAEDLDLDHRIPKSRGGADDQSNRIGLCGNCNRRKGAKAWGTFLDEERARMPHPKVGAA